MSTSTLTDPNLIAAQQELSSDLSQLASLQSQITTDQGQISSLQSQVSGLQAQLTALQGIQRWNDLELQPWELVAGALADSGAQGNVPVATQTIPSVSGQCAWRSIDPQGKSGANGMWYRKLGLFPALTHFTYSLNVLFPTAADAAACQALEQDFQQTINGLTWNWGFQFAFADGLFRVWSRNAAAWQPTPLKMPRWTPQWMSISHSFHRDAANIYYDSLALNGVVTPLGMSNPALSRGLGDQLNPGFQLDGNEQGQKYSVFLDAVSIVGQP